MPTRKNRLATPPGSLATASVTTPATPNKPNNPYYVQAEKLAAKKDRAGLKALDKQLAEAGYDANGQTRFFIGATLEGLK